jgi:hypothetical protein
VEPESILQILLVRAVEEADPRGDTITWQEREKATREASDVTGEPEALPGSAPLDATVWRFLALRAGLLYHHAMGIAGPIPPLRNLKWAGTTLCMAAFGIGWMAHGAGLSHSFDLLAGPFLLVLIWNTLVYALLIGEHFHQSKTPTKRGFIQLLEDWMRRALTGKHPASKAAEDYATMVADWVRTWCAPNIVSWFHAGSACFTTGLLAAIYFRGLYTGYLAGWESTWLGPHGVGSLLGFLLGPASHITGISLPDSDAAWELLHNSPTRGNIPAGPWIHLYAVTLGGWIILPRLLLSLVSGIRASRNRSTPPPWKRNSPYLRRVLALARQGGNIGIAILPFGFKRPSTIAAGTCHDAIERLIREAWGQNARAHWMPCAAYGDEDSVWNEIWAQAQGCGGALLLFDTHATPENEVHGALLDTVWAHFSNEPGGLLVALECSDFDPRRLDSRITAWNSLGSPRGFSLLPLQDGATLLPSTDPPDFLRRTE